MYTVNFKGQTHKVSGTVFWSLALPVAALVLLLFTWFGWMVYLSNSMLADYTGVHWVVCAFIVALLLGYIQVNGEEKAFLPKLVRTILGLLLVLGTVAYQYLVQHWGLFDMALLVAPLVIVKLYTLYRFTRK